MTAKAKLEQEKEKLLKNENEVIQNKKRKTTKFTTKMLQFYSMNCQECYVCVMHAILMAKLMIKISSVVKIYW